MPRTAPEQYFATARAQELLERLDPNRVPAHVAVIMDGNGRWAVQRGKPRIAGHRAGAKATEEAIMTALELGVRYLTIYSFSSENWSRPADEVSALMRLFVEVLEAKMADLQRRGVRLRVIGRLEDMPASTAQAFRTGMSQTEANTDLDLIVALNYGARNELLDAVRSIAADVASGKVPADGITEELIASRLYTADIPDPDLLVRTANERRVSNFLLWQIAYAEVYFTDVMWPDFDRYHFLRAVVDYQQRERRFGGR